jgi:hypothetical protein
MNTGQIAAQITTLILTPPLINTLLGYNPTRQQRQQTIHGIINQSTEINTRTEVSETLHFIYKVHKSIEQS